jgi:hypothetical protein
MVEQFVGRRLLSSASSWDGRRMSALLCAAGYPRHALRLRNGGQTQHETAQRIPAPVIPPQLKEEFANLFTLFDVRAAHASPLRRPLAEAKTERTRWRAECATAFGHAGELAAYAR